MRADSDWTVEELSASVDAYFAMLLLQRAKKAYSKATIIAALCNGPLAGRSRGAANRRMGNISAVMMDTGQEVVSGFAPLANVGGNVKGKLKDIIRTQQMNSLPDSYGETLSVAALATNKLRSAFKGELQKPAGRVTPKKSTVTTTKFERDPLVRLWVLNIADGKCESCLRSAPFKDLYGFPYLETHHLQRLADGGPDVVENVVALCPNCHKELHYAEHRFTMRDQLISRLERLRLPSSI